MQTKQKNSVGRELTTPRRGRPAQGAPQPLQPPRTLTRRLRHHPHQPLRWEAGARAGGWGPRAGANERGRDGRICVDRQRPRWHARPLSLFFHVSARMAPSTSAPTSPDRPPQLRTFLATMVDELGVGGWEGGCAGAERERGREGGGGEVGGQGGERGGAGPGGRRGSAGENLGRGRPPKPLPGRLAGPPAPARDPPPCTARLASLRPGAIAAGRGGAGPLIGAAW